MDELGLLGPESADAVAALLRRAVPGDAPSADELRRALWTPEQPSVVRGDPAAGVVATSASEGAGHLRLLAVAPDARGRGLGRSLLLAAEADVRAAGRRTVVVGMDAPFSLWPGVDTRAVELLGLLEAARYERADALLNLAVDLAALPDRPPGPRIATAPDRERLAAWCRTHWPHWTAEVLRAADRETLVLSEDADGIAAVCAHSVTRDGWVGPVASRPDLIGRGAGRAPLVWTLHDLADRGWSSAEIAWVGPLRPYLAVGARVTRVLIVHRRTLPDTAPTDGARIPA